MGWRRPELYIAEPLDHYEHRLRNQMDPYPGVSSLDDARRDRHLDHEPAPGRVEPLRRPARDATPILVRGGQVPTAPTDRRRGESAAVRGPRDTRPEHDGLPPAA